MADDPPYLTVGTEVSAKYKGAFCEAKIRKVVRVVKCKVTFKAGNGGALLTDDQIKGSLRIGANVEAKHPDKNQFLEATINKIQDSSQYTVVFDDGDITTLRRSALCLKSGRHFNESETLDQLPLTHPEHFSNPVVGGRRGVRRRAADKDDSSEDEEEEDIPSPTKRDARKKYEKELDMGKVVCVDSTDKKKSKDTWFPALVVSPAAQETVKIRIKDEYLVRSFRDGRYYTVPKKEITEFTKDSMSKYESNSNQLRGAVDKALLYLEKEQLPPHWDKEVLFGNARLSESGDEEVHSGSEVEDDPRNEEKDRFIAQLYKFMDDRSTPLNKVPQVCNKDLDLHKLFKIVTGKAGYTKVTNQGQWKSVTIKLGYGTMPTTSTINLVKQAYKKFLFNFEEFYRKLGCTWTPRSQASTSKSRSSRSIFRERGTPSSSSRESARDRESKRGGGGDDDDGRSTPSSTKGKSDKSDKPSQEEKEKLSSSPDVDSPITAGGGGGDTGSESSDVKPPKPDPPEEIRKSARGRQPKKDRDAEESASPSAMSRKKRQATASRDRDRDSSVASSTKEESTTVAVTTPSSKDAAKGGSGSDSGGKKGATTTATTPSGRGKYKRQSGKAAAVTTTIDTDEKEPPSLKEEEKPVEKTVNVPANQTGVTDVRLGDKLQVYYPKSEGKTYEAKVIDINDAKGTFLVHYTGWNNRYDEWIDKARVSVNITLKSEQSGGEEIKGPTLPTPIAGKRDETGNSSKGGPGIKPRKGRNSSSTASTTSASSGSTTTSTTTAASGGGSNTRSLTSKAAAAATSSSPISGKRRRSTSSEVVQPTSTPKRRRTRQKSGQDNTVVTQPSDSEPETSDSDEKSIKSDRTVESSGPENRKQLSSRKESATPIPALLSSSNEPKVGGKKGVNASSDELKTSSKAEKNKSPQKDDEEKLPTSSIKSKDTVKSSLPPSSASAADIKESSNSSTSTSSTTTGGQVLDLDQIRSELKGLDKMMKGTTPTQSVSSPAPPTLSAVMGSSPSSESTAVDIYEFQEDGADESSPVIPPTAPKLKMFSPAATSKPSSASTPTNEKVDKSPVVSSSSAELFAKLGSTQDLQDKVPVVSIEKLDKEKEKTSLPAKLETSETVTASKDMTSSVEQPSLKESVLTSSSRLSKPTATATKEPAKTGPKIPPQITSFVSAPATLVPVSAPAAVIPSKSPIVSVISPLGSTPISSSGGTSASATGGPVTLSTIGGVAISLPPTSTLKGNKTLLPKASTVVPVAAAIVGNHPRIVPALSTVPSSITSATASSLQAPPSQLASATACTAPTVAATIPLSISGTTSVLPTPGSTSSSITSPHPPLLLQQTRPMFTVTSPVSVQPSPLSTPERPVLTPILPAGSGSTTSKIHDLNKTVISSSPSCDNSSHPGRKQELLPPQNIKHLPADPSATASIPTISMIAAKPLIAETSGGTNIPSTSTTGSPILSISTPPQPIKIAAAIPPPPPVVVKTPVKPVFGSSIPGGSSATIDSPKPKKKKAKLSLSAGQSGTVSTPVRILAPLPTVGAPPPPPVVINTPMTSSTVTPTPGRKTPVKKRIPPPMDSPGKPVKPFSIHGGLAAPPSATKLGKMNQEAMNAAIANVGAATPPTITAVPTTVITPTSSIFQTHPPTGLLFANTSTLSTAPTSQLQQPPPPPVVVTLPNKTILPATIKSSVGSIQASIDAVASMGSTIAPKTTTTSSISSTGKSGMPMKRFMRDSITDKITIGGNKDKVFTISGGSTSQSIMSHHHLHGPPPPSIVIGKSNDQQQSSQQQHQPPPPPITIQAKFQPQHTMHGGPGPGLSAVSPVTFVKGPSATSLSASGQSHIIEPHSHHHHQSGLTKHPPPVIIIPGNPVVMKPVPFQQQQQQSSHVHQQQMIVPKPVIQVDGPSSQQSTSSSSSQSSYSSILSTTSSNVVKQQPLLPITVTPSIMQQVSNVPPPPPISLQPSSLPSVSVTPPQHHRGYLPPVELKPVISSSTSVLGPLPPSGPVNTAELPPSITVTKATTVMKSISPDIVAVSSYNSMRSNPTNSTTVSTSMKQENRHHLAKEPNYVAKPALSTDQITFHTTSIDTSRKGLDSMQHQGPTPHQIIPYTTVLRDDVEEPDENSLLCEEIIPGSPTGGESEDKVDESDKEMKKDVIHSGCVQSIKGKLDPIIVSSASLVEKSSPPSSSGGTTPSRSGGSGKPVIVLGPKFGEDVLDDDDDDDGPPGFVLDERRGSKFELDDEDDDNKMDERSVDSPMGPPSEGRETDLPLRDSFSDGEGGDHSPPLSPSTSSSISSDDSSRRLDTSRLSPTPEGGSSKSKDSDDDDMDSDGDDVGSKSTHLDDVDSKHGSTRGSTRIRNQTSRLGRSPSPPLSKRRRVMRRKSPDDGLRSFGRTIRTSSGRKITPVGRHGGDSYIEEKKEVKQPPPPPPVNLSKPPKTGRYNFIPNLTGMNDSEERIALISQCINNLKEQYQKTKTEAASFDRRVKRWKRRIREKERLARQEATRAAS